MHASFTLLVVDDSLDVRSFLNRVLHRLYPQMTVLESRTIQDASYILQSHVVNCVLTNYMLPDGDAHELLAVVRGLPSPPTVIGMSSSFDIEHALLHAGAVAFLVKPFSVTQLVAMLEQWAGEHGP